MSAAICSTVDSLPTLVAFTFTVPAETKAELQTASPPGRGHIPSRKARETEHEYHKNRRAYFAGYKRDAKRESVERINRYLAVKQRAYSVVKRSKRSRYRDCKKQIVRPDEIIQG